MKVFNGKSKEGQAEKVEGSDAGGESANAAQAGTGNAEAASGAGASGSGGGGAGAPPSAGGGAGGAMTPKKIVVAVVGVLLLLWLVGTVIGFFETSDTTHVARNENIADIEEHMEPDIDRHSMEPAGHGATAGDGHAAAGDAHSGGHAPAASHTTSGGDHGSDSHSAETTSSHDTHGATADSHSPKATSHDTGTRTKTTSSRGDSADHGEQATSHAPAAGAHGAADSAAHAPRRPGIATTEAIIQPLAYELEERWWGWRPNDVVNITDNVNNYQLGVLEVTRRGTVALAERLARTGSTASYDVNLERAMNWFMVKAEAYWFPSAESKYKEGLDELRAYKARLEGGGGQFWTRPDNLIPLLASFEDLLGSCDENLVKAAEDDGSPVGFSGADDYFYYTQGVANSMLVILEAIHEDFHSTLETRRSTEILHHAILSLHHATEIQPWLIMESDLGSIFANHRANLAAPISHARFYVGLLIKALST